MSRARELGELASAYDSGGALGFRNRIINGDQRVSQRGTSFALTAPSANYTTDRWYVYNEGAATTATQVSGIALSGFTHALSVSGATGNTAVSFGQRIEASNIADLAGQTVTISGWLFSSAAVAPNVYLAYPAATVDTFTSITNFSTTTLPSLVPNTWTYFSVTVTLNSLCTRGLLVSIQWGATVDGVARYATGVQLEKGSVATPFEFRSIGQELQLCQRYYEKSYDIGTVAATATYSSVSIGAASNVGTGIYAAFKTPKRTSPTIILYSPVTGTTDRMASNSTDYVCSATGAGVPIGTNGFVPFASGITSGIGYQHWVASAEL